MGCRETSFMRALRAEGVPCSSGYHEQYYDGLLDEAIESRGFKRLFGDERLKAYRDSFQELKGNKQVCETTVGMSQSLLMADRSDMDHIIEAVQRIQRTAMHWHEVSGRSLLDCRTWSCHCRCITVAGETMPIE